MDSRCSTFIRQSQAVISETSNFGVSFLTEPFIIFCDASTLSTCCTLNQEDFKGNFHLIECGGRKLKPAEQHYPAHDLELLALIQAC